jgi:hypothetical protein
MIVRRSWFATGQRVLAGMQGRLDDVDSLAALVTRSAGSDNVLIVPSLSTPRLLVPGSARRASARAVRAHGVDATSRARLKRVALMSALRIGLGPRVFASVQPDVEVSTASLLEHLENVLGQRLVASVTLTPPRANRKPVLHLLRPDGCTVAFVKVAVNPLTDALVRHEAETLEALARMQVRTLSVPRVVHRGMWNGFEFVVLSPLDVQRGCAPSREQLQATMHEVATVFPDYADTSLAEYRAASANRARQTDRERDTAQQLADIITRLGGQTEGSAMRFGAWHGDWTPWNCRQVSGRVLVWDWERCSGPVPLGFDALHYRLQQELAAGINLKAAASTCLRHASQTLGAWGVGRQDAAVIAELYLAELATRYLADDQRGAGGRGGNVAEWILPALRDHASELTDRKGVD